MNERQWEALDLIVKAWTTHDGPFSHEGRFFHHRNDQHLAAALSAAASADLGQHDQRRRRGARRRATATCRRRSSPASTAHARSTTAYRRGWREAGRGNDVPVNRLAYAAMVYVAPIPRRRRTPAPKSCCGTSPRTRCRRTSPIRRATCRCTRNVAMLRGAEHPISAFRKKPRASKARSRPASCSPARPIRSIEQIKKLLRSRRRLRPSADHGPGRLPGARRDGARHPHLRARGLSAAARRNSRTRRSRSRDNWRRRASCHSGAHRRCEPGIQKSAVSSSLDCEPASSSVRPRGSGGPGFAAKPGFPRPRERTGRARDKQLRSKRSDSSAAPSRCPPARPSFR